MCNLAPFFLLTARVPFLRPGLYFSFCLDMNDNELAYLESIHLLVELLDKFFASVCELDLVFNFHKVRWGYDERCGGVGGGGGRGGETE